MGKTTITYVTSSAFKKEENEVFRRLISLSNGSLVDDEFEFQITEVSIRETLEVDISVMVTEEVTAAYKDLKIPCIVEHAGLIFDDYRDHNYPGGLTKPMWNTLGQDFVQETHSAGRRAVARAVVAYCDGMSVQTFVGETAGQISSEPRGKREFYWDTVFIPDDKNPRQLTYAQIVEDPNLGLEHKIQISQSTKAMTGFLEWRQSNAPELWNVTY